MPKVMIVDDDRTTSGLLQTLLELDGFEVVIKGDPTTAMEAAVSAPPDAFLVDYHLNESDGAQLVRELRATATFQHVPVIMTSGLDHEDEALEAGANVFLVKPFEPSELVETLSQLINGS